MSNIEVVYINLIGELIFKKVTYFPEIPFIGEHVTNEGVNYKITNKNRNFDKNRVEIFLKPV